MITKINWLLTAFLLLITLNLAHASDKCDAITKKCDEVIKKADEAIKDLKEESATKDQIITEQENVIKNKDVQLDEIAAKKDGEKVEVGFWSALGTALLFILVL